MLTDKTDYAQVIALKHDEQTLQDQYQTIQMECLVLRKHYQFLYEQHQALLAHYPTGQLQHQDAVAYRQELQDFRQSQQEQQRLIQQFRRTLSKHLLTVRSYRSNRISRIEAGRPPIRKNILIGEGNEKDAALLKENIQQASAHRVFLAATSTQVLSLLQNVNIDLLVLDAELTPLPGIELYHQLSFIKGLKALPAIITSACFSPLLKVELAIHHLFGLEKPIKVGVLLRAVDKLLIQ